MGCGPQVLSSRLPPDSPTRFSSGDIPISNNLIKKIIMGCPKACVLVDSRCGQADSRLPIAPCFVREDGLKVSISSKSQNPFSIGVFLSPHSGQSGDPKCSQCQDRKHWRWPDLGWNPGSPDRGLNNP